MAKNTGQPGSWIFAPLTLAFLLGSFIHAGAAGTSNLAGYVGKSRVLLVFASSETDPLLIEQTRALSADLPGLTERDLVLVTAIGSSPAEAGNAHEAEVRHLRGLYDVAADAFTILLIGKDGGVKLRSTRVVAAAHLFAVVDAMPMRRLEMRQSEMRQSEMRRAGRRRSPGPAAP